MVPPVCSVFSLAMALRIYKPPPLTVTLSIEPPETTIISAPAATSPPEP